MSELREQAKALEEEVIALRRRLQDAPKRVRTLEERLLETKGQLAQAVSQNEKLTYTLREAREHIAALREEVDKLTRPPSAYGTFLATNDDGTVDVFSGGRKMRVVAASRDRVGGAPPWPGGRAQRVAQRRAGPRHRPHRRGRHAQGGPRGRHPGAGRRPGRRGARLRADRRPHRQRSSGPATRCSWTSASGLAPRAAAPARGRGARARGGPRHHLRGHRRARRADRADRRRGRAAVPAPGAVRRVPAAGAQGHPAVRPARLRQDAHRQGGGQLVGQAKVAETSGDNEARSYFLNIKGPELLNKYVGETERQIRLVFQRAREKSEEGWPVIVFFDEMDSMFRTRGTGISSDIESTIVPQLLAEIDGVESLRNVIVIGASNREDLIDPAILRPGRLDVKIKIERPDETGARSIFARYIKSDLPDRRRRDRRAPTATPTRPSESMIDATVEDHVRRRPREPLPRGDLPERRQGDHVLQGLLLGRHDREHRPSGQEAGHQAPDRRRRQGHPAPTT